MAEPTDDEQGVAISTLGKVIKRGWDWLGLAPATPAVVTGIIEVPALAASLTLNKADFLRAGPRGANYLAYRKALQEAVSDQLATWGDMRSGEDGRRRRVARPVERDVERVLLDLADRFPMLAMLVEQRAGGGKKLPVSRNGNGRRPEAIDLFADVAPALSPPEAERDIGAEPQAEPDIGAELQAEPDTGAEPQAGTQPAPSATSELPEQWPEVEPPSRKTTRRPTRLGLTIQFNTRPEDSELARLVETTVWVNDAHPAYRRAAASRSEGYHVALSVAMALAELAAEPAQTRAFVSEFLAHWGESIERRRRR